MARKGLVLATNDIREWHITELCRRMRRSDREEVEAGCGLPIEQVVRYSIATATDGGVVFWKPSRAEVRPIWEYQAGLVCIFGVGPVAGEERNGIPWLLGTEELDRHPKQLLRSAGRVLKTMQRNYDRLHNYVHAKNDKSIRFLRHMGFAIGEPERWGVTGELFCEFSWSNKLCVNPSRSH